MIMDNYGTMYIYNTEFSCCQEIEEWEKIIFSIYFCSSFDILIILLLPVISGIAFKLKEKERTLSSCYSC